MCKRLLIVEEALRDLKAHWYEYIKTIRDEFIHQQWQVDVACHQEAEQAVITEFSAFPVFPNARYLGDFKLTLPLERYYSFVTHSYQVVKILWPLLKKENYDQVFVPTVLHHHLLAWWWIMKFHPKKPEHLTLFFVTNPGVWDEKKGKAILPGTAKVIGKLIGLFASLEKKGRVTLAVETKGALEEFTNISGIPFKLFPHPVPMQEQDFTWEGRDRKDPMVHFACLGFARYEKGSDQLKAAIEELIRSGDQGWKFTIQWTDPFTLPDGRQCAPGTLLENSSQVDMIDKPLSSSEYQTLLGRVDCMVLPYRNASYYARLSRILIECLCLGIPVIYTKGGWMEEQAANYGTGIGYEDGSVSGLLFALKEIKDQGRMTILQSISKIEEARKYYSSQNFYHHLTEDS